MTYLIREIANFFNRPDAAERLLRAHLMGHKIIRDDGSEVDLDVFYANHKAAYDKRASHRIPHKTEILELDLTAPPGIWCLCSSGERPPNLDDLERRRTEPMFVYRPKVKPI